MKTFARVFVAITLAAPLVFGASQAFADDGREVELEGGSVNAPLAISPVSGPVTGGTKVTITGRGFYEVRRVTLGGIPLSQVAVNSSRTVITGVTGAAAAPGKVDLLVYKDDWVLKLAGAFTYTAANGATLALTSGDNQAGVAGSTLGAPFVVTAKDTVGNPVTGLAVTFAVTSGGGTLSATAVPTDAQGQAQTTLTLGKSAGVNLVTASATANGSPITFTATGKTGAATQVALTSGNNQNGAAGSPLAAPLVVTVTDANANAVQGFAITFAVTAGGGTLSATNVATNAQGQAQTSLTLGATAGANSVTATATGLGGSPVTFTETATAAAATQIALTSGNTQVGVAGSALANPLVVTVRDAGGNPVAGFSVSFAVSAGGTLSATNVNTNAQGQAQTSLTLGKTAGPNTVTATATGLAGSPVTFNETGTAGPAKTVALTSGNNQNGVAGSALALPLVVTVTDANANPVSGFAITFAVTAGGGTLSASNVATNAQGQAQTALTLGAAAGANTVTATGTGLSPVTFTETATAAAATQIALTSGDAQVGVAGSALTNPFVVTVKDAGGNPVAGFFVTFGVTGGGGTLSATSVATNIQGQAQTSLTLGKAAGQNTVTATATGLAGSPVTFTATGNAGPAKTIALTSGNNQNGAAGSALASPLVVTVTDANANPVSGFAVTFAVTAGGGTLSVTSVATNIQGQAQTALTLGATAGANTVTATGTGLSPVTFTETGSAGAATQVVFTSGNNQSAVAGTVLAPFVVTVEDAGSNPVSGFAVTFAVTGGGGALSATTVATNAQGQASSTLTLGKTAGTNTVTATATGLAGSPLTFTATGNVGPAARIAITSGNNQSAGVNTVLMPFVVTVTDANANAVANFAVNFAVTSGGGMLSALNVPTNAQGQASSTLTLGTTAGNTTVTASATGLAGSPCTFTATATAVAYTYVNDIQPLFAKQCVTCHSSTNAQALEHACPLDSYTAIVNGKTIYNLTPASYVVPGDPTHSLLVQACEPAGAVANFPTSMATYGALTPAQVQMISDWVQQGAINSPATTIAVGSGNNQTGLVATALPVGLGVKVTDASGYPVFGVNVTFAVTSGGGSVSVNAATTDATGVAVTTLTLGAAAGTNTVTATATGLTGSPVTFTETGSTTPPLTYANDIQPLFAAHCVTCHSSTNAQALEHACPLDSYAAIVNGKTIYNLTPASYVVPGDPTNSLLVQACEPAGTVANLPLSMATYGSLTPAQVQTISDWVSQGAKP
jgi:adhesin/invasin